jgi:hypothetical protein
MGLEFYVKIVISLWGYMGIVHTIIYKNIMCSKL